MSKNLWLWDQVCVTDPGNTKVIPAGPLKGKTSVGVWGLVRRATEVFGAMGDGWGATELPQPSRPAELAGKVAEVKLRVWYTKGDAPNPAGRTRVEGPEAYGACPWYSGKQGIFDPHARKKAFSDALKKCLVYLGFSTDIWEGYYDDPGYVEWAGQQRRPPQEGGPGGPAEPGSGPAQPPPAPQRGPTIGPDVAPTQPVSGVWEGHHDRAANEALVNNKVTTLWKHEVAAIVGVMRAVMNEYGIDGVKAVALTNQFADGAGIVCQIGPAGGISFDQRVPEQTLRVVRERWADALRKKRAQVNGGNQPAAPPMTGPVQSWQEPQQDRLSPHEAAIVGSDDPKEVPWA